MSSLPHLDELGCRMAAWGYSSFSVPDPRFQKGGQLLLMNGKVDASRGSNLMGPRDPLLRRFRGDLWQCGR